jgi:predicted porin
LKNSYNVVYDLNRRVGFEAGYEYERRQDEDGQNNLNSFLIGARTLPLDNLKFKASYLKKERKDKELSTLVGPYDSDNFLFNLNYRPIQKFTLDLKYQDRQRDNEEILSSTDSKGFTSFGFCL